MKIMVFGLILGVAFVAAMTQLSTYEQAKRIQEARESCAAISKLTGQETRYDDRAGCFIKTKDGWSYAWK